MRSDDDVVHIPEGTFFVQGFGVEHIQDGLGRSARPERLDQVFLIHYLSPGNIDQGRILLHLRKKRPVGQSFGLLIQGAGEDHNIGPGQEFRKPFQANYFPGQRITGTCPAHTDNLAFKGSNASGDLLADIAETHNQPRCVPEFPKTGHPIFMSFLKLSSFESPLIQCQHIGQHVFGYGDCLGIAPGDPHTLSKQLFINGKIQSGHETLEPFDGPGPADEFKIFFTQAGKQDINTIPGHIRLNVSWLD